MSRAVGAAINFPAGLSFCRESVRKSSPPEGKRDEEFSFQLTDHLHMTKGLQTVSLYPSRGVNVTSYYLINLKFQDITYKALRAKGHLMG